MAAFVNDTFTGAATNLATHVGETGATWTKHPSSGAGTLGISAGVPTRLRMTSASGTVFYYASGAPATADYEVTSPFVVSTVLSTLGITGRMSTTDNTMYVLQYVTASARWELLKIVAGVATTLGTFGQVLTPGQTYTIKLSMVSSLIKGYVDGVERLSVTDTDITAAGKIGVRGINSASDSTGFALDSVSATDVVLTAVGQTRAMPSDVRTLITKTRAMPSDVHTAINQSRALPFDVRSLAGQSRNMPADVRALAAKTRALPSDVRVLTPKVRAFPSDVRLLVARTRGFLFDVLVVTGPGTYGYGQYGDDSYGGLSAIGVQRSVPYDVRRTVAQSRSLPFTTRGLIGNTRTLRASVRAPVGLTRSTQWTVIRGIVLKEYLTGGVAYSQPGLPERSSAGTVNE